MAEANFQKAKHKVLIREIYQNEAGSRLMKRATFVACSPRVVPAKSGIFCLLKSSSKKNHTHTSPMATSGHEAAALTNTQNKRA